MLILLIGLTSLVGGCARWERQEPVTSLKLPVGRMAPDAVAFEIAIAQLDESQTESFESFWALLDQQKLDLPTRQRLDQNGLRVAVMPSHAPSALNRLLESRPVAIEQLDIVEQQLAAQNRLKPKPRVIVHQRITNHDGETYPIQTSEIHPRFDWSIYNQDLQSIGSGESVRGIFDIMTLPRGDGSVRMRLTPQIHHGAERPVIDVAERDFIFASSQSIQKVSDLTFDVVLRPGETLIVAPTSDLQELGELFFCLPDVAGVAEGEGGDAGAVVGGGADRRHGTDLALSDGESWPDLMTPEGLPEFEDVDLPDLSRFESLDEIVKSLSTDAGVFGSSVPKAPAGTSIASGGRLTHRILLVRVVHTQLDDLFGDSISHEKLTTTSRH